MKTSSVVVPSRNRPSQSIPLRAHSSLSSSMTAHASLHRPTKCTREIKRLQGQPSLTQRLSAKQKVTSNETHKRTVAAKSIAKTLYESMKQAEIVRLQLEDNFSKLLQLITSENTEYPQFYELVKEHLFEGGKSLTLRKKLDNFVQDRTKIREKEQTKLKVRVRGTRPVDLAKVIDSQKFKQSTVVQPAQTQELAASANERNSSSSAEPETAPPPQVESNEPIPPIIPDNVQERADSPNLTNVSTADVPQISTSSIRILSPTKILIKLSSKPASGEIPEKLHGRDIAKRNQGFHCICGDVFSSRKSLISHEDRVKNKNPVEPSTSTSSSSLIQACSKHGAIPDNPYQCICGFHAANKNNTAKHIMYHTSEKKFACEHCPKKFVNMGYLRQHCIKVHKIPKSKVLGHGCSKCGTAFKTKKEFFAHSKAVHPKPIKGKQQIKTEDELPSSSAAYDSDDSFESTPLSPQPSPTDVDNDADDETSVIMSDSESEPAPVAQVVKKRGKQPPKKRATSKRDLPHGYSTGKYVTIIHCICGRVCKDDKSLYNHIRYYTNLGSDDDKGSRSKTSRAKPQSGKKLKSKVDLSEGCTGPHREVSISSFDMYTCACGSQFAQKLTLLEHIAKFN